MAVYTRKDWGAKRADGDGKKLTGPREGVVLHHTVTQRLSESATEGQEHSRMRQLESIGYSRYKTGIAYNAISFPSGNIGLGVSWNRRGTHTGGNNSRFYGLALDGDYRKTGLTDAQAEGIAQHLVRLYRAGQIAAARIVGVHSEYQPTACPGDKGRAAVAGINKRAAELLKADAPASKPSKPAPAPKPSTPGKITVDGYAGQESIGAWQIDFGTPHDRVVSSQSVRWRDVNPGLTSGWEWVARNKALGSQLIGAMQDWNGTPRRLRDRLAGKDFWKRTQRKLKKMGYYSGKIDGRIDAPSITIKALQRAHNDGALRQK